MSSCVSVVVIIETLSQRRAVVNVPSVRRYIRCGTDRPPFVA